MRPVLKWCGGKTRLLPDLRARMPATFGRYYEPFAGGAALFFDLEPERAVLGDANADLIGMYRALAGCVEAVLFDLEQHDAAHCESYFKQTRSRWNAWRNSWPSHELAAAFLYLNKGCFNGLWRVNRAGEFNVPWNKSATVSFDYEHLRAASTLLQRAELRAGGYRETVRDAKRGDLVYIDSPYVPVSKTANFTAYAAGGFGPDDQCDLADLVRDLTSRGVYCLVSNSDTPLVRELYSGMRIDTVQCGRAINSKGSGRGKVSEVIVVGFPHAVSGPQLALPIRRRRRRVNAAQTAMEWIIA